MAMYDIIQQKYNKTEDIFTIVNYIPVITSIEGPKSKPIIPDFFIDENPYNIDLKEFKNDSWINDSDFIDITEDEDDIYLRQAQISSLFEETLQIFNDLQNDDNDERFHVYMKLITDAAQIIINNMFEYDWNFDPMDRIIWIYLILACRYESRALKYIIKTPYFKYDLLVLKDKYGYSPLYHAILNSEIDISLFVKVLTSENLQTVYFDKYPLIIYTIFNTNVVKYIFHNIGKDIIYQNSLFLYSCMLNATIAKMILEDENMTVEYFNVLDENGVTCLMHSLIHNPQIFLDLVESPYCNRGIFNFSHETYYDILTLAIKYRHSFVDYILDSKHLQRKMTLLKPNILIEACSNLPIFTKILPSSLYLLKDINVINEIAYYSNDAFRYLLDNEYITTTELLGIDYRKISPILFGVLYNFNVFISIYASKIWSHDFLRVTHKDTNKNITMYLLESHNDVKLRFVTEIYYKGYIDNEMLNVEDLNNFNTFWYFCKYLSEIAIDIIEVRHDTLTLSDEMIKKICFNITNKKIIKKLIKYEYITTELLNSFDSIYMNNFFMEMCCSNFEFINLIMDKNLVNQQTFDRVNIMDDNCLLLLLNNTKTTIETIKKVINSPFMNAHILNQKNKEDEFPFLLICRLNYHYMNLITNSVHFDLSLLNLTQEDWAKCFTFACKSGDLNLIQIICDNELFTEFMFRLRDELYFPYIVYAILNNINVAKYVFNHKLCTSATLNEIHNKILLKKKNTCELTKIMLDSPYCDLETLLYLDHNNNNSLGFSIKENNIELVNQIITSEFFTPELFTFHCLNQITTIEIIDIILNSPHFTSNILFLQNDQKVTILEQYFLDNKHNILVHIIKSNKCTLDILTYKMSNKKCLLLDMFIYGNNVCDAIISKEIITADKLLLRDEFGNTFLHIACGTIYTAESYNMTIEGYETNFKDILVNIKKYINCDKFSQELFEAQNCNGDTFLHTNPRIVRIALDSKYCTSKLLTIKNNKDITLFSKLCYLHNDYLKFFIQHKLFDINYLYDKMGITHKLTCFSHLCISDNDSGVIDCILNLKDFDDSIINHIDEYSYTPLSYCILMKNIKNLNKLLKSKYDLTPSFDNTYKDSRNLLMLAALIQYDVLDIIIRSKYMKKEMFLVSDKYRHNAVIYAFNKDVDSVKIITESEYWSDELKYFMDIDNDFLMIYPHTRPDIVEYLIKNDKCDTQMISMVNNYGKTCLHYYAKHNHLSLYHLITSFYNLTNIINYQDNDGNTPLHVACQYNINSVNEIVKSYYLTSGLISKQNKKGRNALMVAMKYNPKYNCSTFLKLIDDEIILPQCDKKGNTLLFYAARYNLKILIKLLKMEHCNKILLGKCNNKNMTCYMYASKYNGDALKYLLKHPDTSNNFLYCTHMDYGSCLTIAAQHQPIAVKHVLDWKPLEWKVCNTVQNKENFLVIACMYQPDAVKYAIESSIDLTDLFDNLSKNPTLSIACRYQPEAVKYILESKYCNTDVVLKSINEAYECQPKALLYILKSKYMHNDYLNIEDDRGYRLIYRIRSVFDEVTTIKDLEKINLTKYHNELAKKSEPYCNICYTYKQVVLFIPCYHMSCISCAFKLRRCHICRKIIDGRQIIYA
jgi:ankyrin repeat protein